jgi:hypothetical protein
MDVVRFQPVVHQKTAVALPLFLLTGEFGFRKDWETFGNAVPVAVVFDA